MTAINDTDMSNADVVEAVNNGFTRMQEQLNGMQQQIGQVVERQDKAEAVEAQHHAENQREHAEISDDVDALAKQVTQTIAVTDEPTA